MPQPGRTFGGSGVYLTVEHSSNICKALGLITSHKNKKIKNKIQKIISLMAAVQG
jgi:hypothetical protein